MATRICETRNRMAEIECFANKYRVSLDNRLCNDLRLANDLRKTTLPRKLRKRHSSALTSCQQRVNTYITIMKGHRLELLFRLA